MLEEIAVHLRVLIAVICGITIVVIVEAIRRKRLREGYAITWLAAGATMDAIGIQSHMHGGEWPLEKAWQVCETYARFGRPLHFTELTVLSGEHGWERPRPWPTTPEQKIKSP